MDVTNPIIWAGDLNDDCRASWNGLYLRAELMDEDIWWWEVSRITVHNLVKYEIDSSNNYDFDCIGGEKARHFAEEAAIHFVNSQPNWFHWSRYP